MNEIIWFGDIIFRLVDYLFYVYVEYLFELVNK